MNSTLWLRGQRKITFTEKLFILKVLPGNHIVSKLLQNLISLIRTLAFFFQNSISTFIGRKGQNTQIYMQEFMVKCSGWEWKKGNQKVFACYSRHEPKKELFCFVF